MPSLRTLALCLFLAAPALAQPAAVMPHAKAPPRQPPTIEPAARQLLTAFTARYEALRSYSDTTTSEVKDEGLLGAAQAAARGFKMRMTLQRPDKVRLEGASSAGKFLAVGDGRTLSAFTAARPGTFAQRSSNVWALNQARGELDLWMIGAPFFFERGSVQRRILESNSMTALALREDAEVEGTLCRVIEARDETLDGMRGTTRFYLGAEDGLLHRLETTMAFGLAQMTYTETHADIHLNPALPASTWAFTAPDGAKQVETLAGGDPHRNEPKVKIGELLPTFTAPTSDGKTLSLADLRGQVVILYFYHPNVAEDAAKLADLARKYEGKGLKVVAVMMDARREMIPTQLEGKPVPYPFLFDDKGFEGAVPTLLGQRYLGWMYLIDRQGKLQRIGRDLSDLEFSGDIETTLAQP